MVDTPQTPAPGMGANHGGGIPAAPSVRSPLAYVVLTFGLSIPFWVVGAVSQFPLLPSIPIAALMIVAPVTTALLLVYRENRSAGVAALLKRSLDFRRVHAKIWYVPTILLMPGIMIGSYLAMRLMGVALPALQLSLTTTLILFIVFFVAAIGEELGWSGYTIDPLQERYGALGGALVLGLVWAVWHVIPLVQAHRSVQFIAWWSLGTLASRVIITWLYNNMGRSVFVTVLFHTMMNLTWQLFPTHGAYAYYDPRVSGLITAAVAVVVVVVWGPRTLVRAPRARGAAHAAMAPTAID
ncbi:MAG: CPBP family intramembrane metalloprotease [Oscillochloris sp.]|nr:CPBP family intramembrane metalloprotease [Oscillochloris sp.]